MSPGLKDKSGFSLIELLVAVVVVAVGILGIASLQVVSLQQNRSALFRAEALQVGNDILDRMRANPAIDYAPVLANAAPAASKNCLNALLNCTHAEMAEFDIAQWKCNVNPYQSDGTPHELCVTYSILGTALPSGSGGITVNNDGVYTIRVEWADDRNGTVAAIELLSQL